jgi:hypothetical protein
VSRTALGSTQLLIQWAPGALSHLVSNRKNGVIPSLPQYAFMAWCLVKHRDNFTLIISQLRLDLRVASSLPVFQPKFCMHLSLQRVLQAPPPHVLDLITLIISGDGLRCNAL